MGWRICTIKANASEIIHFNTSLTEGHPARKNAAIRGGGKMNALGQRHRLLYVATAFVTLLFMGLIYAWSLFVAPIEADFGWERARTSLIFTLSMISFSLGMVVAGSIERRFSPRAVMAATALIIGGGFIAASFTTTLMQIYVTYGLIVGFGVGVGTDCVMSVAVKWYPEKHGLASGGMLMGFGMGAMLLSPAVTMLLGAFSWQTTFLILGVVFGVLMLAVAFIMKAPPEKSSTTDQGETETLSSQRDYPASEMVRTRSFWTALVWLILVSSGGLGLISQAVPAAEEVLAHAGMDPSSSAMLATAAMGGISLCNGFGRLACGFIWDNFGYRVSFSWISVGFAISMLVCGLAMAWGSFPMIVAGFMTLGLVYGANMASMATISSGFFGPKYFGMNYAVITLQMIASASAGPFILASVQTNTGSYGPAFWVFLGIAAAALVLSLFVRAPKAQGQ